MTRIIKFNFENIPRESTFAVFDKDNNKNNDYRTVIQPGNTCFEFTIPDEWHTPFRVLRTVGYSIPRSYLPINVNEDVIEFNGGDYYVDVDRDVLNEELNQRSVETLIHQIHGNDNLDGRQQFFISLIALQSYFEYLVYGMLVLSGHSSKTSFKSLGTHEYRTKEAFSVNNIEFFTNNIIICPGKENLGNIIPLALREEVEEIFNQIRTLRNKVVHGWGYKDIPCDKLRDMFSNVNEAIDTSLSDNAFYQRATSVLIRLYAKTSQIRNQLSLFNEKYVVNKEREERGY